MAAILGRTNGIEVVGGLRGRWGSLRGCHGRRACHGSVNRTLSARQLVRTADPTMAAYVRSARRTLRRGPYKLPVLVLPRGLARPSNAGALVQFLAFAAFLGQVLSPGPGARPGPRHLCDQFPASGDPAAE